MIFIDPETQYQNINHLIYRSIKYSIEENNRIMEVGWSVYIKTLLQVDAVEYKDTDIIDLVFYLNSILGKKLYIEQQVELCNVIKNIQGVRVTGKTIQTSKMKKIFNELKLNYNVKEHRDKVKNQQKQQRYIIITT